MLYHTGSVCSGAEQCVEVSKETTRYFARLRGMLQTRTVAESFFRPIFTLN